MLDKSKITLALIIDMYAHQIGGGFMQPKFVHTYLKLKLPKHLHGQIIKGDFKIPQADMQSGYIKVGKKIMLYVPSPDKVVYLGPEGDWETMLNEYGIAPNDFKTLNQDFSEGETYSMIQEIDNHVTVTLDGSLQAECYVDPSKKCLYGCKYYDEDGKKLLKEFAKSRDLKFPKDYSIN